jgi:menaquinone-specific isochorismate synthase
LAALENTANQSLHLYGVWDESEGVLGATPEILFSGNLLGKIETCAVAGTRLKPPAKVLPSRPPEVLPEVLPELLNDPKELQEHRFVIEGICSSLRAFARTFERAFVDAVASAPFSVPVEIEVGVTRELQLPSLSHLMTPISIDLTALSRAMSESVKVFPLFEELVRKLHPTPALGGFPRDQAQIWLRTVKTMPGRMRFGAPFGIVNEQGEAHCVVGIRNIQWKDSVVLIGAGCGIIVESDLDREWKELLGKIQSIRRIFGWEAV